MPLYLVNIASTNPNTDNIERALLRLLHYEFPASTVRRIDTDPLQYDPKRKRSPNGTD